jgi:methylmalonyl-CoA/ethylmalonyl-CoA epimerase
VTLLRRLDHVAILVRSTDAALRYYQGELGLPVHSSEEIDSPHVRLDPASALGAWLDEHGEGLHHICFGVDDVPAAAAALSDGVPPILGSGRGRTSAFVTTSDSHGVRIECTQFLRDEDVDRVAGWLPPSG